MTLPEIGHKVGKNVTTALGLVRSGLVTLLMRVSLLASMREEVLISGSLIGSSRTQVLDEAILLPFSALEYR